MRLSCANAIFAFSNTHETRKLVALVFFLLFSFLNDAKYRSILHCGRIPLVHKCASITNISSLLWNIACKCITICITIQCVCTTILFIILLYFFCFVEIEYLNGLLCVCDIHHHHQCINELVDGLVWYIFNEYSSFLYIEHTSQSLLQFHSLSLSLWYRVQLTVVFGT